jgi:hypothetical protein
MAMQELHQALPELAHEAGHEFEEEMEGAAPVWRGAYPQGEGEAETEAFFESLAEYAVSPGGGGRGGGHGRFAATAAATAAAGARSPGVPLAQTSLLTDANRIIEGEMESALSIGPSVVHPAALMEHLGHAAAEAESEAEAAEYFFPLIPLAAKLLAPQIGRLVMRQAPRLIRGVTRVGRQLRRNRRTRPLVRVLPTIARRTVADIANRAQAGQPVTPRVATTALTRQTYRTLRSPHACVHAYRRSRRLDRRYHVTVRQLP